MREGDSQISSRFGADFRRRGPISGGVGDKAFELLLVRGGDATSVFIGVEAGKIVPAVLFEVGAGFGIAALHHAGEVWLGPGVHESGAYKGDVSAEVAVEAGTIETDEDAETGGGPGRVFRSAIEAGFVLESGAEAFEDGVGIGSDFIGGGRSHTGFWCKMSCKKGRSQVKGREAQMETGEGRWLRIRG